PVSTLTFALSVTWWGTTLGGLTFWLWQWLLPDRDPAADWPAWLAGRLWLPSGLSSREVESGVYLAAGIVFGVTLPWVIGGLSRLQHAVAAAMLGRWPSDDLADQARQVGAARQAAVHAEDTAMRRLERDLHDGPQQRLIRLQMDLAAAERRVVAGEPEAAADYTRQARAQAQAALEELRALSRGVAPPLLTDRGLRSALAALAEESPLPATADLDPDLDRVVSPEVARAVYFVVAELFTNAARHSGASRVEVTARVRAGEPPELVVAVSDDGRGGARLSDGHGLAGLAERVSGLLGTMTVESPAGGPTRVEVQVPAGRATAAWPSYPEA
ncbi:MAG: histidine kinase, partial [Propionicimonas sp.]|nr:histidine kinase [Propionicimonas sp.]